MIGAPLELRVLGRVQLLSGGREVSEVLAQPSRLALLAYLALARPHGYHRRDSLLPLLWPDSTDQRARGALRQALMFLRRALGAGSIRSRGAGEIGIGEGVLTCDAVEFLQAAERGDDTVALARYRGDLLPGLHVPAAPDFERWLERERTTLRRTAAETALRLADSGESAGDLEAAADWARRALELDPSDEVTARRLISLLDRAGNRAAAVLAYEALAERLRKELELEPSPETMALVERIRERAPSPRAPADGAGDSAAVETRRAVPERVLVLPFRNRTGDRDLDPLGAAAAELVEQGLSEIAEAAVIPSHLSHRPGPGATADGQDEDVSALAARSGAGTIVDGTYYLRNDSVRFEVRVTDLAEGRLLPPPEPVEVPREDPVPGLERLRKRVPAAVAPYLSGRSAHVRRGSRPPSYEAFRAYMDGLELFIRADWRNALDHFVRARQVAPDYALPRIVQAIAHWNLSELPEALAVAREAAALRHTIAPFERAVLDMVLAWLRGDWAAAYEWALRQAELAPGSIPHFQVAEEARRLNRPREARAILQRIDPGQGEMKGWLFYWIELTAAHHMLGDHGAELEAAAKAEARHPDHPAATLLTLRALAARGESDRIEELLHRALATPAGREPGPGALLRESGLELRAHGHEEHASALLRRSAAWYQEASTSDLRSPAVRRDLARTLYHAGRLDEAGEHFEALVAGSPDGVAPVGWHHAHLQAHLDAGYLAVIASRTGDREGSIRWKTTLESMDGPFLFGAGAFWRAALAAVEGRSGDGVRLLRRAFAEGLPHGLFLHVDPHLARLRGDAAFDAVMAPRGEAHRYSPSQ